MFRDVGLPIHSVRNGRASWFACFAVLLAFLLYRVEPKPNLRCEKKTAFSALRETLWNDTNIALVRQEWQKALPLKEYNRLVFKLSSVSPTQQ